MEEHHLHLDNAQWNFLRLLLEASIGDARKNAVADGLKDFVLFAKSSAVIGTAQTILSQIENECDCL
jgi:hypothetical protein